MKSSGKAFFGSIVMSMILIASVVSLVSAGGSPVFPMGFEGTLTLDGSPASAGTQVKGLANGIDKTVKPPYTTDNPGMYGDYALNRFKVDCQDGDTVTFSVEVSPGIFELADQSDICERGSDVWLDLIVGEPSGECTPGDTRLCGTSDVGECSYGTETCSPGGEWGACTGAVDPLTEICDGLDNDCDGTADEDFPNLGTPCSDGEGACEVFGEMVCTVDGTGTECSVTAGTGGPEVCDGIDNDCDGQTDEDWPELGTACVVGLGECEAAGVMVCTVDQTGTECSATPGAASAEVCDGLDNDCDGTPDNMAPRSCGLTDVGVCTYGVETCDMGSWTGCTAILPGTEICDSGLDEDCDGYTDCDDADCAEDPNCIIPDEHCIQILSIKVLNSDFIEDYYIFPGELYNVEVQNYNSCEDPIESMQIVQINQEVTTPINIGTVKSTIAPYTTSTVTVGFVLPGVGLGTEFVAEAYNWNHWISQDPGTWEALSAPASVGFEAGTGGL